MNTGWSGGAYGTGSRIRLKYTRAMLDAIYAGALRDARTVMDPTFGLEVIAECPGAPSELMLPRGSWADKAAYDRTAAKLAGSVPGQLQGLRERCHRRGAGGRAALGNSSAKSYHDIIYLIGQKRGFVTCFYTFLVSSACFNIGLPPGKKCGLTTKSTKVTNGVLVPFVTISGQRPAAGFCNRLRNVVPYPVRSTWRSGIQQILRS